jgi:hypothetical protein
MSEHDFELYLTLLAKTLRLSDKQRSAIASELRDHLEARLEELTAEGHDKQQAIATALAEFGDASALANDFTTIGKHRHRRRIMQTAFGTIAAAAVVAFAVMTLTPNNYQGHPAQPMAGAQGGGQGGGGGAAGLGQAGGEGEAEPGRARGGMVGRAGGLGGPRGGGGLTAEPLDLSIHVLDCTEILAPREDGLDLLERTEALAKAVEQTVATVSAQGPSAIHVRAFEEFLIITATDDAYAQAESLLENISAHVQRRDAIRRDRAEAEARDELQRLQVQIEETMHERLTMQERLVLLETQLGELQAGGPEALRLSAERDDLANRIDVLQARQFELEAHREHLITNMR